MFNKDCLCTAKEITIGKTAECTSYEASENFDKHEKSSIKQKAIRNTTKTNCKVHDCIFYNDGKCIANGITVATLNNKSAPECLTIKEK